MQVPCWVSWWAPSTWTAWCWARSTMVTTCRGPFTAASPSAARACSFPSASTVPSSAASPTQSPASPARRPILGGLGFKGGLILLVCGCCFFFFLGGGGGGCWGGGVLSLFSLAVFVCLLLYFNVQHILCFCILMCSVLFLCFKKFLFFI